MCNCMNEKIEQMKEKMDLEYVLPPIEILSGRAILEFEVKEKGKKEAEKCLCFYQDALSVENRMTKSS